MKLRKFIYSLSVALTVATFTCGLIGCAGLRPPLAIPNTPPPVPTPSTPPKVVLVLGSGGARGYAHLGVLQALQEAGIPINTIVCASAGCVVGALYADNANARKTFDIMMHAGFWTFADVSNLPNPSGIVEGYHLEKFLLRHMHAVTFNQLKIKLITATTDLKTGKTYAIASGPIAPAILASAALPGLVQPVHLYGHVLIDGGVADPVPTGIAKQLNPTIIIAVNVGQQLPPRLPKAAWDIYARAYNIMWQHLTEASEQDAQIIIRPHVGQVGTFDLNQRYQMYLDGLHAAQKEIPAIKKLLAKNHITLLKIVGSKAHA